MLTEIKIELPYDFEIICLVFALNPADVLQDYVNRISLPRLFTAENDPLLRSDMQLILNRTESQDPTIIDKKISKFQKDNIQSQISGILKSGLPEAEQENMCRQVLRKACLELIQLRKKIRSVSGISFNIVETVEHN